MAIATLLPMARAVFYDQNGNSLAGGLVHTYVPGGNTPKTTWEDAAEGTPNSNPVILDADGSCLLYGYGAYQITVTDALGNAIPAYSGLSVGNPVSDAMRPVVSAATIAAAQALLGIAPDIATVAALQAATTTSLSGSQCYVLGYYATGDGGEGFFMTGAATTANGGTIVNDASGRSWYRQQNGAPIVSAWFGVRGDDSTNDAAALLAAGTYAAAVNKSLLIAGTSGMIVAVKTNTALTCSLDFTSGGQLAPTTGITVSLSGAIIAGQTKIFGGVGTITLTAACAPNISPYWLGAKGDSTTDDAPALQAAINLASASGIGMVFLGAGGFKCNTGLTISGNGVGIEGVSQYGTSIISGVAGLDLIKVSAGFLKNFIKNMALVNNNVETSTGSMVHLNGSVDTEVESVFGQGGYYGMIVDNGSADCHIRDCRFYNAYLHQIYIAFAGVYFDRINVDMAWTAGQPVPANDKGNWAALTAYSLVDFVRSSGFYFQCIQAGTTASSPLSATTYNTTIVDGTVRWRQVGNTSGNGFRIDSNCNAVYINEADVTGAFLHGILICNLQVNGAKPTTIWISNTICDANVNSGIQLDAGTGIAISKTRVTAPVLSGKGNGIQISSAFGGELDIDGNLIFGCLHGVEHGGGGGIRIRGNSITGSSVGIQVSAGVGFFVVADNNLGASDTWGGNTNALTVAVGASDYYNIINNLVVGATTGITDGGTGIHKTITGNV